MVVFTRLLTLKIHGNSCRWYNMVFPCNYGLVGMDQWVAGARLILMIFSWKLFKIRQNSPNNFVLRLSTHHPVVLTILKLYARETYIVHLLQIALPFPKMLLKSLFCSTAILPAFKTITSCNWRYLNFFVFGASKLVGVPIGIQVQIIPFMVGKKVKRLFISDLCQTAFYPWRVNAELGLPETSIDSCLRQRSIFFHWFC